MAKKRRVFLEPTPLGYRILLTRDRWREIVRFKHPVMAGREASIAECVRDPDSIRASAKGSGCPPVLSLVRRRDQCAL